ncbi:MAG: hypothetical protein L0332_10885 [Chloroflexi bacterium]|nr:hypothetical protein [Chloroflexota bacterium]MCI0575463.1 hypothetical protein [Chloroflexota bacterium]MCI0645411.1 hypothetical protein [Chloroflexota bacterium]MCI0727212.1 hypothetical protein [Chloroflexota bacterium]
MRSRNIKTPLRLLPVLVLLTAGIWLLQRPASLAPESATARQAQADQLGLAGAARERYLAEPGENPAAENEALLGMGDYWATRYTYPTGQFDQRWLVEAAAQDALVPRGIPAGEVVYDNSEGSSPLNLDPTQFTSLGPMPLQSDGCISCFNYGHVAGRTNVAVSDPISPNIAYIGSDGGGVWKSENCCDENTTWTAVTDDPLLSTIAIGDIVLDPNDHNTIYAGTGDLRYGSFSFGAAGVLKSVDAGATWTVLGLSVFAPPYPVPPGGFPQYQAIGKVQVDPNDSDNVIVGAKTGVYFSYDGGANWSGPCLTNSHVTQRQDITGLLVSDAGANTDLYAAVGTRGFGTPVQPDLSNTGANAVYKTTVPASGCPASWTLLNTGWPAGTGDGNPANDLVGRIDLAMAPSDNDVIYAQVANNTNPGATIGVWQTTNGGTSWTQRATPADFSGCGGGMGQTWYNAGVVVDPNDPNVVFLSQIDVYRSVNGADTFINLTDGYCGGEDVHVDQHARAYIAGDSSRLLVGSDGGIYVTDNADDPNPAAVAFTQMNDTLPTIEWYAGDITANFAYSAQPGINAGAQDNGSAVYVWSSGDPGPAMWQVRKGGDGMYARIEPVLAQRWYQESQNGNLAVTVAGPYSSQVSATGGWVSDSRLSFVFPYEIYKYDCPPTGCAHLIAGSYRVWETIVGGTPGTTWYINSPDLTKNTLADRSFINQLAFAVSDETVAIAGTNDGNVQYGFDLGQGVLNTATWVNVTGSNAVLPNRPILDVATDPANPLIGYAAVGGFDQNTPATPGHVFRVTCTADCGSFTWLDKSGNLPNIPVDSIIANPNFPQQVFAGTDWGLYYTDDITAGTPTWNRFQAGLPNVMIWDMSIDAGFTTLALFTRSRGAYVWPLPNAPVVTNYAVQFGPDSTVDTQAGEVITHTFTLVNRGQNDDSYDLAISGNTWPTTLLTSTPISITAGSWATIVVEVQVPSGPGGTDSFTLTATSTTDSSVTDSATGTTNATPTSVTYELYLPVIKRP